jgi:hypothetical protein
MSNEGGHQSGLRRALKRLAAVSLNAFRSCDQRRRSRRPVRNPHGPSLRRLRPPVEMERPALAFGYAGPPNLRPRAFPRDRFHTVSRASFPVPARPQPDASRADDPGPFRQLFAPAARDVNHSGLLNLALRKRCLGIHVQQVRESCVPSSGRWVFKATVYKSPGSKSLRGCATFDENLAHITRARCFDAALRASYYLENGIPGARGTFGQP